MRKFSKKCLFLLIAIGTIFTLFTVSQKNVAETIYSENTNYKGNTNNSNVNFQNRTIIAMIDQLKDETPESIAQYFNDVGLQDSQKVIADGEGILFNQDPNFNGVLGSQSDDKGNEIIYDLRSPDAATVGEIKEALNIFQKNNLKNKS